MNCECKDLCVTVMCHTHLDIEKRQGQVIENRTSMENMEVLVLTGELRMFNTQGCSIKERDARPVICPEG